MKVSKINVGTWIRSVHFTSPLIVLLIITLGKPYLVMITIAYCVIASIVYLVLQECLLSKFEQLYLGDDVYGVDLALEVCEFNITKKSRFVGTIIVASLFYLIVSLILYTRFIA
jgi:hypothetical protein